MIRFPWNGESSPHFVLELTDRCNIACRGCYKRMGGAARPLEDIIADVDFALARRRIDTVSLAGAEPTLHPQLCEVVRQLRQRRVHVALITNGLALGDELLEDLAESGLDVVMLHIDEGQTRPDIDPPGDPAAVEALRTSLVKRIAAYGIDAGLSVTLYPENLANLPKLVNWILHTPEVGFAFITHYQSPEELRGGQGGKTGNDEVVSMLREEFGFEPFVGLRDGGNAWISYFVPVIYHKDVADPMPLRAGWADAILIRLPRLLRGRHMYYCPPSPATNGVQTFVNLVSHGRFVGAAKFLAKIRGGRLGVKRIVFDDGRGCCDERCPNSTVRQGKFVPVCRADIEGAKGNDGTVYSLGLGNKVAKKVLESIAQETGG